jgi:hypothetical protein
VFVGGEGGEEKEMEITEMGIKGDVKNAIKALFHVVVG